ncbi:hypothetical protein [uncultured Microbulbifer sp.]|uniref:hypothetical protein n=1 Tax=uncultured Microbulbifer sp. TaxID=348147 RepID=UPI0026197D24|nr:hypothetical protein [uncultured Microbulbifer sp.]
MVRVESSTKRYLFTPRAFQVSLDLNAPGAFLAAYRLLLRDGKPSLFRALERTTWRLLMDYRALDQELTQLREQHSEGLLASFRAHSGEIALTTRVTRLERNLLDWVSWSLVFYGKGQRVYLAPVKGTRTEPQRLSWIRGHLTRFRFRGRKHNEKLLG